MCRYRAAMQDALGRKGAVLSRFCTYLFPKVLRKPFGEKTPSEKGFALAYIALMMTVLVGIGGFAVDVGHWYLKAQRLQRSADSAALAGSVFLPGDATSAKSIAEDVLLRNYDQSNIKTISQREGHPTQLKVQLTETVNNYFVGLVGFHKITLTRAAVAEYRPYVPMGSPSNMLGQEPSNSGPKWEKLTSVGTQSNYWLNIAAAGTAKSNGDRYSGGVCNSGVDLCNTSKPAPTGNADYSSTGQDYIIRIANGASGWLNIQAYDAGFAYVGDNCSVNLNNADQYSPGSTHLYRSGNNEPGCTGDQLVDTGKLPPPTTYQLYTPTLSAGGSQPISTTRCSAKTFDGYKGQIAAKVNPNAGTYDPIFTGWFRKWTTVCQLYIDPTTMPSGDYILRVRTTNDTAYNGLNRFALRAAFTANVNSTTIDATQTAKISLFAKGRLVIYAHENTGDVVFYIARLQSGAAGRQLTVSLFDIGDADGGASLSFLPPSDARVDNTKNGIDDGVPLTSFSNCKYMPPGQTSYINTASGCSINNMTSGTYNGRLVTILTPVPEGYTCNDASSDGCWTRLRVRYGAGSTADTTSWEVALDGNPVRLVIEN